jgi:hypothetical protein
MRLAIVPRRDQWALIQFVDAKEKACRQPGIRIAVEGDLQFLVGLQLQGSSVRAGERQCPQA